MAARADIARCDHTVLYDDDCGFCRWLLDRLLALDRDHRLRPVAIQSQEGERLLSDLGEAERLDSWHLITPDGRRLSAGAALPPFMRLLRGGSAPAALLGASPWLTERAYRLVAANRSALSRALPIPRGVEPRSC